jgi:hypothetical protein
MTIKDIKPEDLQKISGLILGLASLGMQLANVYSKYKVDNPDLTLEQFISEVTRIQNIPTDWNKVYEE